MTVISLPPYSFGVTFLLPSLCILMIDSVAKQKAPVNHSILLKNLTHFQLGI